MMPTPTTGEQTVTRLPPPGFGSKMMVCPPGVVGGGEMMT
jgi:hypothetical protein